MKKLVNMGQALLEFILIFSILSGILPSLACGILYKFFGL